MGHFGAFNTDKSQTANRMVAIRHIDGIGNIHACVNIMSLYNSFKV